ncbi:putative esterase [Gordonia effusa NBRC 100432]|uniref:Putative esterase n=1 Tax=Gordonia effusa NBRC 100432 TaxID=1077974 RepID=H0QZV1_9ACTN|nr:putative esterase [Gordonia effusa NBRC 100432]
MRITRLRSLLTIICAVATITAGTALLDVGAGAASAAPGLSAGRVLDLQAHRGGRGEHTEESLAGFAAALRLGVSTLELDIVVSRDHQPLVWHDPKIQADKCADTKPARPGDPQFPYVGKLVHDLTLAQLETLVCAKVLEKFPTAHPVAGNRIATLAEVFALAGRLGARNVGFNIETKIEAEKRADSATPIEFVAVILNELRSAQRVLHRKPNATIQSFDWRSLPLVKLADPSIKTVALWDETTWKPNSAWLGPVNYAAVHGDPIAGAKQVGASILSPGYSNPSGQTTSDRGFRLVADAPFIRRAHAAGLKVIPWTINDEDVMTAQINAGADGIITDYPTKLRALMAKRGMVLPRKY